MEFEPGTPGSEITELPTKPRGSWRVQLIEKATCLWFLFLYGPVNNLQKCSAPDTSRKCTWRQREESFDPRKHGRQGPALLQVWYLYTKILQVWDRYKRTLLLRLSSELKTKKDRLYVLEDSVKI